MIATCKRNKQETWRDCVKRYAKPHGLETEVLEAFDLSVGNGEEEGDAAFHALYEWDLLGWEP